MISRLSSCSSEALLWKNKYFPISNYSLYFCFCCNNKAALHPCCSVYLNSSVPASNHKLSSVVLGLSQLPLPLRCRHCRTVGGLAGCSLNNRPSHKQTLKGASRPSGTPKPTWVQACSQRVFVWGQRSDPLKSLSNHNKPKLTVKTVDVCTYRSLVMFAYLCVDSEICSGHLS